MEPAPKILEFFGVVSSHMGGRCDGEILSPVLESLHSFVE
jgi:hypothetical protein